MCKEFAHSAGDDVQERTKRETNGKEKVPSMSLGSVFVSERH